MAITPAHLREVLDASEIRYQPYDETTLLTVFSWEEERVDLVCSLWEEGEYLDVRTVNLAHLTRGGERALRALPAVSHVNFDYKVARVSWGEDGELIVGAALPLEDQEELARDQVAALITAVCQVAVDVRRALAGAGVEAPRAAPPAGASLDLPGLGRFLLGLGVFFLGLAALIAAAAVWVR